MEELIMAEFEKTNSKPTHILMMRSLNFGLFKNLNPKQRQEADIAIQSLIEKQYVTYENGSGSDCLRLTDLGFAQLYKNSKNTEQIGKLVMNAFEKQHSKSGHIVMMRNINHNILQKLNPVEGNLFADAINSLIEQGLITYEQEPVECLRLTYKGYEQLY
ncbi:hypothetical protein ACL9RF_17480 [Sphingobacterium sp. Mn56C]|uniref:hypothetical protein n=1 Tax=Sphingobacterium sp. Mn56C TaxID=3395261 RepID=UPI003BE7368D